MKKLAYTLLLSVILLATACSSPGGTPTAVPVIPTEPVATVLPTEEPTPTPVVLSFKRAGYGNVEAGFELDYPEAWTASGTVVLGDRGSQALFTAPDGTVTSLTDYGWEPVNDLEAYAAHRKEAWIASGMTILSEEPMTLASGQPGIRFITQTAEGEKVFFFLTPFADFYLELSGPGDPAMLSEIASTIRPISNTP